MNTSSLARSLRKERSTGRTAPQLDRVTIVREDGSILVRRRYRQRTRMPLRGIAMAIVALFLAKGAVLAHLGPETHRVRMVSMASDNFVHQTAGMGDAPRPGIAGRGGAIAPDAAAVTGRRVPVTNL